MHCPKIAQSVFGLVLCLSTAACDPSDRRKLDDLTISQERGSQIVTGVRFLSACPSKLRTPITEIREPIIAKAENEPAKGGNERKIGPLGSALVATGVDVLLESISAGLVSEQEGRNGQFIATGVYLGEERLISDGRVQQNDGGCLVIYRGVAGSTLPKDKGNSTSLPRESLLALGLSAQPAIYIEFTVTEPLGLNKRMLELNRIDYAASSARKSGSGLKSISVVIGLGAEKSIDPNAKDVPEQSVSELFRFNLGRLEIGKIYTENRGLRSIATKAAKQGTNMVALVTEADHDSVALQALTKAFDQNKKSIDDALTDKIKDALN